MLNGVYPPNNDSNAAKFHRQTVMKCFQKSEILLKIAMNHMKVPDVFINTFMMMTDASNESVGCTTEELFKEKSKKKSLIKLLEFRGATKPEMTKILDKYSQMYNDNEVVDLNFAKEEEKAAQTNWKKIFIAPPPAPLNPPSPLSTSFPENQIPVVAPPVPPHPTATNSFMNYFSSFNKTTK